MGRIVLGCLALLGLVGCAQTGDSGAKRGRLGTSRTFEVRHDFILTVPDGVGKLRAWLAMPQENNPEQKIHHWRVECPYSTRIVSDSRGNRFLYLEASNPKAGRLELKTRFTLERFEIVGEIDPDQTRVHSAVELEQLGEHLGGTSLSEINANAQDVAVASAAGEKNPVKAGVAVYQAIIRTTDSLDLPSLFAAVARASGIPTRAVHGATLDGEARDAVWMEIHAPGLGWIPVDVSGQSFGALDAKRLTWHRSRDLLMSPPQAAAPLPFNATAHVELDGRTHTAFTRSLTFDEVR